MLTEHLSLRRPRVADEEAYGDLFLRPELGEWLRPEPLPPFTIADSREILREDIRLWGDLGFGPWVLIERAGGSFVGRVGLRRTAIENESAVELAWTVDPDRQGRGSATEAATAAIELARSVGLDEVVALTLPGNRASRRVAEKIGMRQSGEVQHAGLTHLLYRLALA
ncbi:MAG TPA: GNAT family N-acetyltransferase [Solirubrobacterales bacterium]|nr:GNAT family N-acetyltransferase [Solirubrobacterales bacterium]